MALAVAPVIYTLADYLELPECNAPVEFLRGERIEWPMPRAIHQRLVARIGQLLSMAVEPRRFGLVFVAPLDVLIRERPLTVRQPDVFVVPQAELDRQPTFLNDSLLRVCPCLAVEVLSDSNTPAELARRSADYALIGIQEMWWVDPDRETVQVLVLQAGGYHSRHTLARGERLRSKALPFLDLSTERFFGRP